MNVAKLSSSAVIVHLNISCWTGKRQDKKVSQEIDITKGTSVRAGTYSKDIMANNPELIAIGKYASGVRNWFVNATLPWDRNGAALVPTAQLFDMQTQLVKAEQEFNLLVDAFIAVYSTAVQAAQFKLGDLFDADEYPDVSTIKEKFSFSYVFSPVPEAGDFRVDIGNEGLAELQKQYEVSAERRLADAMQVNWDRLYKALSTLSRQLHVDKSTGDKGKLYDSTLDAALELCDMLSGFNLTGDAELELARKQLQQTLQGVDLKELRKDDVVRGHIKEEIDAIIGKFNW